MSDRQITAPPRALHTIMEYVAERYGVSVTDLKSKRRSNREARPRQIAMYLSRALTFNSLPAIGSLYHRDHTTVMHAVQAVEDRIAHSPFFAGEVNEMLDYLKPRVGSADAYEAVIEDTLDRLRTRLLLVARRDPKYLLSALSAIADREE